MGIHGLHGIIKPFVAPVHLSQFRGAVAAVDLFCYFYKSAYAAEQISPEPTTKFLKYFEDLFDLFDECGIKPVLVLDGRKLLAKKPAHDKRDKAKGKKPAEEQVDLSHTCVKRVKQMAKARCIDVIVAPFEADSQLGWLFQNGYCNLVITEDSDLIVFGCDKVRKIFS